MSENDYFPIYVDILSEAFSKIRKIGFKRFNIFKNILDTVQGFLAKEVYGRIEPSNYLLILILALGSKAAKLYPVVIQSIQKLFSYNFISANEDLSSSVRLIKEEHRELMLLSLEDYHNKSFKEVYIETLIALNQKDVDNNQFVNLSIVKSFSLIWRLNQSSIATGLIGKMFDFVVDALLANKIIEDQKVYKSAFLEMVRHAIESYKESQDSQFLEEDNNISLKSVCYKYGNVLVDQVVIQQHARQRHGVVNYEIIPGKSSNFTLLKIKERNERNEQCGKFGWCINCRKSANYFCQVNRVAICSYECKELIVDQLQSIDKFVLEQKSAADAFQNHLKILCKIFSKYFNHPDIKKKLIFSEIFIFVASQFKKINDRRMSPIIYKELRQVVRQIIANANTESQNFNLCLAILKKMLYLRIFVDQYLVLIKLLAKKLVHFLTPSSIRDQILKFCKEIIHSKIIFDLAVALDCNPEKDDAIRDLIDAIKQLYIGITIPQQIINPPPEDPSTKKLALETSILFMKALQECQKVMPKGQADKLIESKEKQNKLKFNLERINKSEKPHKVIKKLIGEGYLKNNASEIAEFLHKNLRKLSLVNIGVLIGDLDQFAGKIRKQYIEQIPFKNLLIDQAMRVLLKHFTPPGQSQVLERIIQSFGIAYFQQNQQDNIYFHSDAVYSLSYLIMMLQTNLHNPQVIEKMTLLQFAKLSKGMNGSKDAEFPPQFLQKVYSSVQQAPLGIHEKFKEIEIINSYKENPKRALQLHIKQLQKQSKAAFEPLKCIPYQQNLPECNYYPIEIFIEQYMEQMIDILTQRVRETEQKEEIIKLLDQIENIMEFSCAKGVTDTVERAVKNIWEEITRISTIKKYILMESFLEWVRKYCEHLYDQWSIVIFMLSKFNRSKLIKKQNAGNKSACMVITAQKCYIYESFIDYLLAKSSKYNIHNLSRLVSALIEISKQEIAEGCHPFCLERMNQLMEANSSRSVEIFPLFWPELKQYYTELGKHKSQNISLFGTDFLKQLITKFIKRKDLIVHQRQYLKPFEDIFLSTKVFAVKEYIIGGLGYFINNHFLNIRHGWKVILSILWSSFEEEQDARIKDKSFAIVKKIYETNFTVINLEENYMDLVQILGRLARQKEETYAKGCLQAVRSIIEYYHKKLNINLDDPEDNPQIDINFCQTILLPLLSTIYGICGDTRQEVQQSAIDCLFNILMRYHIQYQRYGKLFQYDFWKMVLQGVLRPTFEEITFTSQSKPLKKQDLEIWLKNSFSLLFNSINDLIYLYYYNFRMFLFDVFKIYQNCILNHSIKILIQLSLNALNDLLNKVANNFQVEDWETYLQFTESVLKKTIPNEISSVQNWNRSKEGLENNYEGKCFALYLFLIRSQEIYQKYPQNISENIYLAKLEYLEKINIFVINFNQNIELRQALWKDGFYVEVKSLPGLIKHELQILKFQAKIHYKLINFNRSYYAKYFEFVFKIFQKYSILQMKQFSKVQSVHRTEKERKCANYQTLLLDTILPQINEIGIRKIESTAIRQKLFMMTLPVANDRIYCSKCPSCDLCETNYGREKDLAQKLKLVLVELFQMKSLQEESKKSLQEVKD